MKEEITKLETWLPIFPGFYGTIFENDDDEGMEIDRINETRKDNHLIGEVTWDMCEWDYESYHNDVAERCSIIIEGLLKGAGLVDRVEFQRVRSPREYNFANDAVDVEVSMTHGNLANLSAFVVKRWETFEKYIHDHYTSYDGFRSWYSNDANDWMNDTQTFTVFGDNLHQFGAVLQFCCMVLIREDEWENRGDEWLRDQIVDYPYIQASNYDELTCDHIVDEEIVEDAIEARVLNDQGFEFVSGWESCYALNRTLGEHRITQFKGFWVKGGDTYGVNTSAPQIDVYAVKIE